jgi:hypothetical protein
VGLRVFADYNKQDFVVLVQVLVVTVFQWFQIDFVLKLLCI